MKVNKELSKINMIQVSKIIMPTNITQNGEKSLIHYQNWSLSTEDEITNCYHYYKKKRKEKERESNVK